MGTVIPGARPSRIPGASEGETRRRQYSSASKKPGVPASSLRARALALGSGTRGQARTHHPSREAKSPELCQSPRLIERGKRSADRRSGASAPVFERTSNVGPRVPAQGGFHRLRAGGRSPLGAPPRRFIGAEPARAKALGRCHRAASLAWRAASHDPLVVAEGGVARCLPGVCVHAQTRGTPHPALLMRCLAKSTLGGRNVTKVSASKRQSTKIARYAPFAWHNVSAK